MATPPFPRKEGGLGLALEHFATRGGPEFFVQLPLTLSPHCLRATPQPPPSTPE